VTKLTLKERERSNETQLNESTVFLCKKKRKHNEKKSVCASSYK